MKAFALTELLVVLVIVVGVAAWVGPTLMRWQPELQVRERANALVSDLRLAAMESRAGWQDSVYGIKFESDRYIIYQGGSYALRESSADRVVSLPNNLSLQTTVAGEEVVFDRRGIAQQTGEVTISHGFGKEMSVVINEWASFKQ